VNGWALVSVLITALFGGGAGGAVIIKLLSRPVDTATAAKIKSDKAATDVDTLREIIAEVRASEAQKTARIDALEDRLNKLEERERHALTRAAVHEAWDQLAINFILLHDQNFPQPPPIRDRSLPASENGE
jgi:hypothetical protein